jgi:ligand-binding SRPBCC domain-containing protein
MRLFSFQAELWLPRNRADVFDFFANALNLEEITPPWLQFHVTSSLPIEMREGTEIQYRLKIRGFPVRWRSRITVWEPPNCFVDEQLQGPYRRWVHEHRFSDARGGTLCEDRVQYAPLGGALVNALLVRPDVAKIFAYRSERLQAIFAKGQDG